VRDSIDAEGYRANVAIVLMREPGTVFLGGRTGARGWQFPQGGVREGESADQALYRELNEEVGLNAPDVELMARTSDWLRYRLPQRYVRRDREPLCIGQKQRWYLLKLRDDATPLKFDSTGEPPEFDRGRWVGYWEPVKEVVYFKRQVYRRALHELGRQAFPEGLPAYPAWWGRNGQAFKTAGRSPAARLPPGKASAPR
jgi:putative (di)nucleoside polyphosphate hydrolase